MNKTVFQTLKAQKNQQEKLQESTNNEKFNSWGLVFTGEEGNYYHPRRLREHFFKILHKAGLPKRRFHDLRHTFGTLLISSGNDIRTVQVLLGHADIATSTIYAHITRDKRRESVNDVEKLISNCI